ncbi:MAG: hypothetical protein NC115_12020 [Bacteroidales bacterium]|nr:hypothetical protein [Bacteroidales bacterium]
MNSDKCPECGPSYMQMECPNCNGTGHLYWAYDIIKEDDVPVTMETWLCLPESEEDCRRKGQRYIKSDRAVCQMCEGEGYIYEEEQTWKR